MPIIIPGMLGLNHATTDRHRASAAVVVTTITGRGVTIIISSIRHGTKVTTASTAASASATTSPS